MPLVYNITNLKKGLVTGDFNVHCGHWSTYTSNTGVCISNPDKVAVKAMDGISPPHVNPCSCQHGSTKALGVWC